MKLSACIVVYNGYDEALKAAQTVLHCTRRYPVTLYLVVNVPYGYVKDPENPKHWLVDSEAKSIVRGSIGHSCILLPQLDTYSVGIPDVSSENVCITCIKDNSGEVTACFFPSDL